MPKASAPKAPWVEVCESPQTIVIPGLVRPSSGPMMWTMPCEGDCTRRARCRTRRSCGGGPHLAERGLVDDVETVGDGGGGDIVVHSGHGAAGAADLAVGEAQAIECLG